VSATPWQAPPGAAGRHLVLYDGVCGLCSRLVRFLLRHDGRAVFDFASLQSPTGKELVERSGGDARVLTTFYVVADYRTPAARMIAKGRAAVFVAAQLAWPWKIASAGAVLPTWLLNTAYDVVARNRYRVFGRYEQCLVPNPQFRSRFID
jgi:predicted DCC family thiol-disulfide oxidoreductase YuxK